MPLKTVAEIEKERLARQQARTGPTVTAPGVSEPAPTKSYTSAPPAGPPPPQMGAQGGYQAPTMDAYRDYLKTARQMPAPSTQVPPGGMRPPIGGGQYQPYSGPAAPPGGFQRPAGPSPFTPPPAWLVPPQVGSGDINNPQRPRPGIPGGPSSTPPMQRPPDFMGNRGQALPPQANPMAQQQRMQAPGQQMDVGALLRRLAGGITPRVDANMTPSTRGMFDSVLSGMGAPPEDFWFQQRRRFPTGPNSQMSASF